MTQDIGAQVRAEGALMVFNKLTRTQTDIAKQVE
jgi:hypothetical protein